MSFRDRVAFASIGAFFGAISGAVFAIILFVATTPPTFHLSVILITVVVCATVGFVTGNRVGDFVGIIWQFIVGIFALGAEIVEVNIDSPKNKDRIFVGVVVVLICVVTYLAVR